MLEQMDAQHAILSTVLAGVRSEQHWDNWSVDTNTHNKVWLTSNDGKQFCIEIVKTDEQ